MLPPFNTFLAPFAKTLGMRKIKQFTRFSEQGWMVICYTISWVLGVVSSS